MITTMTENERYQAAMLLQRKVEHLGWELMLDDSGGLLVRIGDDMEGVPQSVVLAALFSFAPEFECQLQLASHMTH